MRRLGMFVGIVLFLKLCIVIVFFVIAIVLDMINCIVINVVFAIVVIVGRRVGARNRKLRGETELDSKISTDRVRIARLIQFELSIAQRARALGIKRQRVEAQTENADARQLFGRDVIGCDDKAYRLMQAHKVDEHKGLDRTIWIFN